MLEAGEHLRLVFESFDGVGQFLWTQTALAHLLDRHHPIAELQVRSLVNRREAASTKLHQDAVSLFEELILQKPPGQVPGGNGTLLHRLATDHTESRLR